MYRYGAIAWIWRTLIGCALLGGSLLVFLALRTGAAVLALIGAILIVPSVFFGLVVATRIERTGSGGMQVRSLLFTTRTLTRDQLRSARVRQYAQGTATQVYAPRAWIPVRGGLPVYVDLLAEIPEPRAFAAWWGVPVREMPGRR